MTNPYEAAIKELSEFLPKRKLAAKQHPDAEYLKEELPEFETTLETLEWLSEHWEQSNN